MAVKMENLKKGEVVDIVVRRHWIAFALIALYFLGAIFLSVTIFLLFGINSYSLLGVTIFWMFYSMFLYINWLNYDLDLFIFTNNRIVCIEQVAFLNRSVGETTLDKVQEVNIETKGLFASLFDYGTLKILTAGASPSFDMTLCPKPMKHSRYINNLVDKYRDNLYGGGQSEKKKKTKMNTTEKVESILQKNKESTL